MSYSLMESERRDVLSVSPDVDPTRPENRAVHPAYVIEPRNAARETLTGVDKRSRRAAEATAQRVLAHVESKRPQGRRLAIFAATDFWRGYVLSRTPS